MENVLLKTPRLSSTLTVINGETLDGGFASVLSIDQGARGEQTRTPGLPEITNEVEIRLLKNGGVKFPKTWSRRRHRRKRPRKLESTVVRLGAG